MSTSFLNEPAILASLGIVGLLNIASIVVFCLKRAHPEKSYLELHSRVVTWWKMTLIFLVALTIGGHLSPLFFAFLSFLALKEYFSLIPTRRADRRVILWAYLAIPMQYLWVGMAWYGMFIIFIPVYMFLLMPIRMVMIGDTKGFLNAAGTLHWGLMTTVFSLSHAAFLFTLPASGVPGSSGAALVLFLVFLTEFNDIAQYTWGKLFGQAKIIPKVSPNKTWAGFLGGVLTSICLALPLGLFLTPMNYIEALGAGLLIGCSGFFGDVAISALKRDLGIKDSGTLLPGHGGILDRVDSLSYTAPLFFHYLYYLHY